MNTKLVPDEDAKKNSGKTIDADDLTKLCDARDTICAFCKYDKCDKCIITHLVNDAHNDTEEN